MKRGLLVLLLVCLLAPAAKAGPLNRRLRIARGQVHAMTSDLHGALHHVERVSKSREAQSLIKLLSTPEGKALLATMGNSDPKLQIEMLKLQLDALRETKAVLDRQLELERLKAQNKAAKP